MPYYAQKEQNIPTVAEALGRENVENLKKLVALLPTAERPARKGELIALILSHLEGEKLRELWSRLDDVQQAAVMETAHSPDGIFLADRFRAKYGQAPDWGSSKNPVGRLYGYGYDKKPSLLALFIHRNVLPDDLRARLKEFVPKPTAAALKVTDEVPEFFNWREESFDFEARRRGETRVRQIPIERRETERAAQADLQTVLRLVETGKVTVSDKTLRPTSSAMKTLAPLLRGGDYYYWPEEPVKKKQDDEQEIGPIKAFAWPLLLQAARLAEMSGNHLALTKAGRKALGTPSHEIIRAAWRAWLRTKIIDELRRVEVIKGQTGGGKRGLTAVEGRRRVIADALAACPAGKWIKTDDFFRFMQAAAFDFEVTRDPWELYVEEKGHGSLGYEGFHAWHILQGRYALCLLFEYAATLGLIDVAYVSPVGARRDYTELWGVDDFDFFSRYDGLLYFRLNSLGAYCLGVTDNYTPSPAEAKFSLSVLPSLKITVVGERLESDEIMLLDAYAEKASDAQWHLSQAKTMEAIEGGHQISELREFLAARDEQPLPETAERFIADAEARSQLLRDRGTARLVECADAALAELIANDLNAKRFCLRAGDRHLVVFAESEAQFRKALHRLGYSISRHSNK